jgi:hypothetical protein
MVSTARRGHAKTSGSFHTPPRQAGTSCQEISTARFQCSVEGIDRIRVRRAHYTSYTTDAAIVSRTTPGWW